MKVQMIKMFDDFFNSGRNLRIEINPCKLSTIHFFVVHSDSVNLKEDAKMVLFISVF